MYYDHPNKLLFQMVLEFYDGTKQIINSDESWKTRLSPIISNSIYSGEIYDARLKYGKDWTNASIFESLDEKYQNSGLRFKNAHTTLIFKEIKVQKITK